MLPRILSAVKTTREVYNRSRCSFVKYSFFISFCCKLKLDIILNNNGMHYKNSYGLNNKKKKIKKVEP